MTYYVRKSGRSYALLYVFGSRVGRSKLRFAQLAVQGVVPFNPVYFIAEVESIVDEIARYPELGTPYFENTRRMLVRRFPFSVVYQSQADHLLILAVAHQRRRPGYWRDRV